MRLRYPGTIMDSNNLIQQRNPYQSVVFADFRDLMLSQEDELSQTQMDLQALLFNAGQSLFLDTRFCHPNNLKLIFASFPRSGNTYMRTLLESLSGLATGSDLPLSFMLNVSLQYSAFKGEGHSSSSPKSPPSCWIHKTHYPYVIPYQKQLIGNQVLVCVRNPFDVFPSQFLKFCTMTHNLDINEDFTQFPEWELHLSQEVGIWKRWHYYWIRMAQEKKVPVRFVRFEDVREGKDEVLLKVMEYCFRGQISKESVIGRRIASGKERDGKVAYKPKKKRDNMTYYKEDQKLKIMTELRDLLRFFGYSEELGQSSQPYFNIFNAQCEEYWSDKALPEFKTNNFWSSDSINMLKEKQIHKYFDLPMKVTIKDPNKMPEPRD